MKKTITLTGKIHVNLINEVFKDCISFLFFKSFLFVFNLVIIGASGQIHLFTSFFDGNKSKPVITEVLSFICLCFSSPCFFKTSISLWASASSFLYCSISFIRAFSPACGAFRQFSGLKLFSPVGDDCGADGVGSGGFCGGDFTGFNLGYELFFEACFELSAWSFGHFYFLL